MKAFIRFPPVPEGGGDGGGSKGPRISFSGLQSHSAGLFSWFGIMMRVEFFGGRSSSRAE